MAGAKILLGLLVVLLPAQAPILIVVDDTIERRSIVQLPWCNRPWALPFMTILAPSQKANEARGRTHKTAVDWTILAMRVNRAF